MQSASTASSSWDAVLGQEFAKPYWRQLQQFVNKQRADGPVYPPADQVLAALQLTPHESVKVLILGQDPYHGPGQAHGLCFSVSPGVKVPPSLRNIHKELHADLGHTPPDHGNLQCWAEQGVLLLNATLTVNDGSAGSHQGQGWETFTDQVITAVSLKPDPVVFVLWGGFARKKKRLVDTSRHVVVESAHPSPLSAHRGFLGSKPFSQVNDALERMGKQPVDWQIPPYPVNP